MRSGGFESPSHFSVLDKARPPWDSLEVPTMSFVQGLRCKVCGTLYPIGLRTLCPEDFGPLEVAYDYEAMRGAVTRESIERQV